MHYVLKIKSKFEKRSFAGEGGEESHTYCRNHAIPVLGYFIVKSAIKNLFPIHTLSLAGFLQDLRFSPAFNARVHYIKNTPPPRGIGELLCFKVDVTI